MKAVMLMDVIDKESCKNYLKGQVIDVFYDCDIDEYAVFTYFKKGSKTYKHWFPLFYFDHPEYVQIKIIDNDGINLEEIREKIVENEKRGLEKLMGALRIAFNIE